jgi:uncharacterized GH25 family protein
MSQPSRLATAGVGLALVLAGARGAGAHDYWLELSSFHPEVGERVAVTHRVGERLEGEAVPRNPLAIVRFDALSPAGATDPVAGRDGFDPAGVVAIDAAGAWRVVYQGSDSLVELAPEKFDAYLELEGLDAIRVQREKLGEGKKAAREAFSRSAIAFGCAGGAKASSSAARRPVGLELEIVPDGDLCAAKPGAEVGFRLLRLGQPAAGVLMVALDRTSAAEPMKLRSDAQGRFRFRLPRAGLWLIKGVAMERAAGIPNADWKSRWASLTFELAGGVR